MKIMSYNTLHCMDYPNRRIDFEATANVIKKYGADIVGLNEMRGEGTHRDYTAQTEKLSELTGMNYYFAYALEGHNADKHYCLFHYFFAGVYEGCKNLCQSKHS